MRAGISITVTPEDRLRLEVIVGDRNTKQKHVKRAKVILATADGCGTNEIMRRSELSKPVVWRWQERFMREGVDGLTRDKTRSLAKSRCLTRSCSVSLIWPSGLHRENPPTGPGGCWPRRPA